MVGASIQSDAAPHSARTLTVLGTPLCVSDHVAFTAFCQRLAREPACRAVDFTNNPRRHAAPARSAVSRGDGGVRLFCAGRHAR